MAVVYVREVYRGVGMRVQYTGRDMEASVVRKFIIRCDDFFTGAGDICAAPGITVGSEHPALAKWFATEFAVDCEDGNGLVWGLSVTYKANGKELRDDGLPKDEWSITSSGAMLPAIYHMPNPAQPTTYKRIQNSAGAPIEGLKKEYGEVSWKLVRSYATAAELMAAVRATSNMTNASAWGGGNQRTWKCDFKSGVKKKIEKPKRTDPGDVNNENAGTTGEMEAKEYWEGVFEFRFNPAGWDLKPWDAGFMEKDGKGGLKAILGSDKKPVKEPWKLDGQGKAITDPAQDPVALTFIIYPSADFSSAFGSPPA